MGLKVTNNAFGTLNAGINSSATSIVLTAGQGARFPTLSAGDYFYATLIDTSNNLEIVKVTARSTDTMTVVRGQDNTTARAYSTNDRFELRPTAALFNEKANANEYLPLTGGTLNGTLATTGEQLAVNRATGNMARLTLKNTNREWTVSNYGTQFSPNGSFSIADETAAAVRFQIDTAGRVTMASQPTVFGQRTAGSYTTTNVVVFDNLSINIGSHYSTSTGRFTAPISGLYQVICHGIMGSAPGGTNNSDLVIRKNGSYYVSGHNNHTVVWDNSSVQCVVSLSAGDYVDIYFVAGTTGVQFYGGNPAGSAYNGLSILLVS